METQHRGTHLGEERESLCGGGGHAAGACPPGSPLGWQGTQATPKGLGEQGWGSLGGEEWGQEVLGFPYTCIAPSFFL